MTTKSPFSISDNVNISFKCFKLFRHNFASYRPGNGMLLQFAASAKTLQILIFQFRNSGYHWHFVPWSLMGNERDPLIYANYVDV